MPSGLPNERRSIRDIPVSPNHRRAPQNPRPPAVEEDYQPSPHRPRRKRRYFVWLFALAVFAGGGTLLLSTVFAGATVTVYPRTATVEAPQSLEARLNAPVDALEYQTFTVERSATTSVPATGTKTVSRQASGVASISNSYSSASQRLIANTRFEAPDGKIYRIRESVVVPGMSGGKAGTVGATIYADSPGPAYNRSAATAFTIPGFKGDPRYGKFSARSEGPIEGGFVGEEPAIAPADLAKARAALEQQLVEEARAAAAASTPEGYLSVQNALQLAYSDISQSKGDSNTVNLSQTVTGKGVMLRGADLATIIARQKVEEYGGEAVRFEDVSQFSISLASTSKLSDEKLTLLLTGSPTLVWQFDQNAVEQALLGKPKIEFQSVIESFAPAIRKADASIRPFWRSAFPSDPNDIKIIIAKEE